MRSSKAGPAVTKILKCLLAGALAAVFLAVVPLHQHSDGKAHYGECQICVVSGQSLLPAAGSVPAVIFILLFLVALSGTVPPSARKAAPRLRGPPLF